AQIASDEQRAGRLIAALEDQRHADRRAEAARDGGRSERLQGAEPLGGEIACDAIDAERIGSVRRDLDIEHRVIEAEGLRRRRADRNLGVELDDALMLVGDLKLALGNQHAVRFDAADDALFERDAGAGYISAGG